jgi:hypothetical protein
MALLGEWEQGVKLIKKAIIPLISEGDIFYITVYCVHGSLTLNILISD